MLELDIEFCTEVCKNYLTKLMEYFSEQNLMMDLIISDDIE
jgi:fructose-bisphosphate aldolase class 1